MPPPLLPSSLLPSFQKSRKLEAPKPRVKPQTSGRLHVSSGCFDVTFSQHTSCCAATTPLPVTFFCVCACLFARAYVCVCVLRKHTARRCWLSSGRGLEVLRACGSRQAASLHQLRRVDGGGGEDDDDDDDDPRRHLLSISPPSLVFAAPARAWLAASRAF